MSSWTKNDFGGWSWNLKKNGHRTPYYIHTTPDDEAATLAARRSTCSSLMGVCMSVPSTERRS